MEERSEHQRRVGGSTVSKEELGKRRTRTVCTEFTTREESKDALFIEGYFAVFNSNYEIAEGMSESIAQGAFAEAISGDIRALVNHDTTLVLGRTKAGTFEVKEDSRGLWGRIRINPNDSSAVDLYERVKRGDVDGCSIGFDIAEEETEFLDNGDVHWTIKKVFPLYECSCCTFPAYAETSVQARKDEYQMLKKREIERWKADLSRKLKGGN